MDVHLCQLDCRWLDPAANHERVGELCGHLRGPGVLLLPEMFATGFALDPDRAAQPLDGPTPEFLRHLAAHTGLHVLGGVAIRDRGRVRNEALMFAPDGERLARYAKARLFTPAGEDRVHEPGDQGVMFSCLRAACSIFICYDLRFPELFRHAVSVGAGVCFVLASWPATRAEHWRLLLRARAIENQAWVIGCNRCGRDPQHDYPGASMVVDPHGEVSAAAGPGEQLISATLDLPAMLDYRRDFPVLRDM